MTWGGIVHRVGILFGLCYAGRISAVKIIFSFLCISQNHKIRGRNHLHLLVTGRAVNELIGTSITSLIIIQNQLYNPLIHLNLELYDKVIIIFAKSKVTVNIIRNSKKE